MKRQSVMIRVPYIHYEKAKTIKQQYWEKEGLEVPLWACFKYVEQKPVVVRKSPFSRLKL